MNIHSRDDLDVGIGLFHSFEIFLTVVLTGVHLSLVYHLRQWYCSHDPF
jgi:hypothetical protein